MLYERDWADITGSKEAQRLLDHLNENVVVFPPRTTCVRKRDLVFYDAYDLYELWHKGDRKRAYLVWDQAKDFRLLDWNAVTIHALNKKAPLRLGQEGTGQQQRVEEYLQFFCNFIKGDEGPFFLVESAGDIPWTNEHEETAELRKLKERIRPIQYQGKTEGDSFRAQAAVVYSNVLFISEFRVDQAGMVKMLSDKPVAEDLPLWRRRVERVGRLPFLVAERGSPERLTADEFCEKLKAGAEIEGAIVFEPVDLEGEEIARPVRVRDVIFQGDVNLTGAVFRHSVQFDHCEVFGCFLARHARGSGDFSLRDTTIRGRDRYWRHGRMALKLDGAQLDGSLLLDRLRVEDYATAQHLRVGGSVAVQNCDFTGSLLLNYSHQGSLAVNQVRVKRDPKKKDPTKMSVEATNLCAEFVSFQDCDIEGSLNLDYGRIGSLFARADRNQPNPTKVGGDLSLSGLEAPGHVELDGIQVDGSIIAIHSRIGALHLKYGWRRKAVAPGRGEADGAFKQAQSDRPESEREPAPVCVGGAVVLSATEVEGRLNATGLQVQGNSAALAPTSPDWLKRHLGSFVLDSCTVHSDVSLCGLSVARDANLRDQQLPRAKVAGRVEFRRGQVRGDVDLRDLGAGGKIQLRAINVDGEVKLGAETDNDGEVKLGAETDNDSAACETSCSLLELQRLGCHSDVDLSGLRLDRSKDGGAGHIKARRCTVEGRLQLFSERVRRQDKGRGFALIPGYLDLTSAKVDRLILCGLSFSDAGGSNDPAADRLKLERAAFNLFQLHDHQGLAGRVNLRHLTVQSWSAGKGEEDLQPMFRRLLRQDRHKDRSTFRSMERWWLARGMSGEAEQVRCWMYNAARHGRTMCRGQQADRKKPGLLKRSQYWLLEWFGYSRWKTLLLIFILGLVINGWLFSPRSNFCPSLTALQTDETLSPKGHPADWGHVDATMMAIRYQIPMISLIVREEWRASPFELTVPVPGPSPDVRVGAVTAEDWGAFIWSLSWMWWAFFLLSVSGVVRRLGLTMPD